VAGVGPVLVTGAGGMLGTAFARLAGERSLAIKRLARADLDITEEGAVLRALAAFAKAGGRLVVNAAAYTDVERAEDEPEAAYRVNQHGAALVAAGCRELGLAFLHVSTDFVFDGKKHGPYKEEDEPAPLSIYGVSKLAGERAVLSAHPDALVVRTAWVYGPGGANFPLKVLEMARRMPALRVVVDEVGSPTYTLDLAPGLLALAAGGAQGLFHLTGSGSCSRFTLAGEVLRLAGMDRPVEPVNADSFPTKAKRPRNSVLDCAKAAARGVTLPSWRDGLARFVAELHST
jgi:dTDP-4-dehydrorhamnose reductase